MAIKNTLRAKCKNHFDRESVAVCTVCKMAFCRECASFYKEKITCSACVKKFTKKNEKSKSSKKSVFGVILFATFLILGWSFFYLLAFILSELPSELGN